MGASNNLQWSQNYQFGTQPWQQAWRPHAPPPTSYPQPYPQTYPPQTQFPPPPLINPYQQPQQFLPPIPSSSSNPLPNPPQPPKPTSIPTQPNPNPNNKPSQPMYNNEVVGYPTYPVNTVELEGVELRSRKALQGPTIIEINEEPEVKSEKEPLFPDQLLSKHVQKEPTQTEFDLINELRNVNIKIPLLQVIKDILVYNKTVQELYPGSPVSIGKITIPNALVDSSAAINVMTNETKTKLSLEGLRPTPAVLQMVDRSLVKLEGVIEDVVLSIDSWDFPTDFMILQPKVKLGGYPLILGRPWLATANAFINCWSGKQFFSFLDGFSGYNQIRIAPEDQDKTTFTRPWGTFAYNVLPFGLCNAPATFQRAMLSIFADLVNDCVEVYMDDFTVHDNTYEEAKENLEKVLKRSKDVVFSWTLECQEAFETIKTKLVTTPDLRGPNWELPFHIHIDASDSSMGAVLGQKEDNLFNSIYYVSKNFTGAEVNYMVTEKDFLAVVYAIYKFHHYITGYKVFVHIDHSAIRFLMNKPVVTGRVIRCWLLLQEFDVTILDKPGRENVVADFLSRLQLPDNEPTLVDDTFPDEHLFAISAESPWFADIANYLVTCKFPPHFSPRERRKLVGLSGQYTWINGLLFCTGIDNIMHKCVSEEDVFDILRACHIEPCGRHFATQRTSQKILTVGYYWPTIHKDYYVTKWVEVIALKHAQDTKVADFLYLEIFTRFGVPREITTDQGPQFTSELIAALVKEYEIRHWKPTPYHPQANGQVEVTNRELENILTKMVALHKHDWAMQLLEAIWAYHTTWKTTTGLTPYKLVYGKKAVLLIKFKIKTLQTALQLGLSLSDAQKDCIAQLHSLDELH
ncbi:uncharacterized protein LOC131063406 [Cryptomeria japonica]|uniref:uncharacterized protein LOC131063406 n=1 Tax=Cryptomeria japonica TaxID=3369 RepID=UPI0027DA4607|nr:uncharacterized protein LOC131063406 [Cryptomeria japonica]